jgi:hypothetical protein
MLYLFKIFNDSKTLVVVEEEHFGVQYRKPTIHIEIIFNFVDANRYEKNMCALNWVIWCTYIYIVHFVSNHITWCRRREKAVWYRNHFVCTIVKIALGLFTRWVKDCNWPWIYSIFLIIWFYWNWPIINFAIGPDKMLNSTKFLVCCETRMCI